ncbi:MAG TPA: heavy metal translocating P-type ATPase [Roseiarcus sp.]|nr:heavy metal translocating P-type ATPase [Roseiarcus sp.]
MAAGLDLSGFVVQCGDGSSEIDFAVQGMTCAACVVDIERAVRRLSGGPAARVNYTSRRLRVAWRGADFEPGAVAAALSPLGYKVQPFDFEAVDSADAAQGKYLIRCVAIAGFAAMNVMLLSVAIWAGDVSGIDPATRDLFHWISGLIALPAALFAGQPFFKSAASALRSGRLNMDVPISIGVALSLGMSVVETMRHADHAYFDSALMLMFFLLAGRAIEHQMRLKTRSVVNNLSSLRAPTATRIGPSGLSEVLARSLQPGDRLFVRSGERLPADGAVSVGETKIDDSLITGETARRTVKAGDLVYAGSINLDGAIEMEVGATGAHTLLDEVERMLDAAAQSKSRYVQLADRAARLYAPIVHLAALLTAIGWIVLGASLHDAIIAAIAVLIITCPCALALAVPAVHVVASGALFKRGLLLRKGDALERFAEIDTVVFDKTGTLTLPDPGVLNCAEIPSDMTATAARLALSSRHPLARSLAVQASGAAPLRAVVEDVGSGVRAVIDGLEAKLGSPSYCDVAVETTSAADAERVSTIAFRLGERAAIFRIRQTLRPDAKTSIDWLKRHGLAVEILSGDSVAAVREVAAALGVEAATGGLKPADKAARLVELRKQGRRTLMVGDGLNDAPALSSAHASISPATAADVAQSVADAVFLGDGLSPICAAIALSRAAKRRMLENLALAALYNLFAVPLAVAGFVTPLVAALAMSGSSLLVTLNALRARRAEGFGAEETSDEQRRADVTKVRLAAQGSAS